MEHYLWFKTHGIAGQLVASDFTTSFIKEEVEIGELGNGIPFGLGLYVFDALTQSSIDELRTLTENSFSEVIAVSLKPLSGSECWQIMSVGVIDVVHWEPQIVPKAVRARLDRLMHVERLLQSSFIKTHLVGQSKIWLQTLRKLAEVAYFSTSSVLITGETGTGKELIARLVHSLDARPKKKQLITVDCTTVSPELAGSELFGHERGAYTSAIAEREGALALANGGTLFLDEIGELPLAIQSSLLRATQENTYKKVGGNTYMQSAFRLVAATNRNLLEEIARGSFRNDLFHRIATWHFRLPSLRERTEDILPLARHFLAECRPDLRCDFDVGVAHYLVERAYPGNIRELKQVISRLGYIHAGDGPITIGDLPAEEHAPSVRRPQFDFEQNARIALLTGMRLKEITKRTSDAAVRAALDAEEGNVRRAARRLGITDRALQLRLADLRQASENADE